MTDRQISIYLSIQPDDDTHLQRGPCRCHLHACGCRTDNKANLETIVHVWDTLCFISIAPFTQELQAEVPHSTKKYIK